MVYTSEIVQTCLTYQILMNGQVHVLGRCNGTACPIRPC